MTILMGVVARYPLALATGLGLNAFVTFSIAKAYTWTEAMTFVFLEGVIILVLVLTGFRVAVFKAVPTLAEDRHQRRHRSLHRPHRPGRRRLRASYGGGAGAGGARHRRRARRLADPGLRVRARAGHRALRAPGQGRHPHRDRRHHRAWRSWSRTSPRSGRRSSAPRRPTPRAGSSTCPRCPSDVANVPGLSDLKDLWSLAIFDDIGGLGDALGSYDAAAFIGDRAADLHAAAGRLLRHHGHDDRDRRRGRPARRAGHAAAGRSRSSSWTRWPRPPAARRVSRRTRPTSSPPPASARAPAPAWPRS